MTGLDSGLDSGLDPGPGPGLGARPGGQEWVIRHESPGLPGEGPSGEGPSGARVQEAAIVQVGATLRRYTVDGVPRVHGFGADVRSPAYRGAVLLPWPNRVGDGRYTYGGVEHQLPLTEPERGNANHGLVCWASWRAVTHEPSRLVLETTLHPQPGWDWTLTCRMTYEVGPGGLSVTPWVRNDSATTAPFGVGFHPYLTCGEEHVDELELRLPADAILDVDPQRLLPRVPGDRPGTSTGSDTGSDTGTDGPGALALPLLDVPPALDLRDGPSLVDRPLDTAYTRLTGDADGTWRAVLRHPASGRTTTLWAPLADYGWAQVFSGDQLPEPDRRRTGVAVEPMTCGPDALRTGADLIHLAPGAEWSSTWGLTPH